MLVLVLSFSFYQVKRCNSRHRARTRAVAIAGSRTSSIEPSHGIGVVIQDAPVVLDGASCYARPIEAMPEARCSTPEHPHSASAIPTAGCVDANCYLVLDGVTGPDPTSGDSAGPLTAGETATAETWIRQGAACGCEGAPESGCQAGSGSRGAEGRRSWMPASSFPGVQSSSTSSGGT